MDLFWTAFLDCHFGLIAQWIEHPPSKRVVVGSNPTQSIHSILNTRSEVAGFGFLTQMSFVLNFYFYTAIVL